MCVCVRYAKLVRSHLFPHPHQQLRSGLFMPVPQLVRVCVRAYVRVMRACNVCVRVCPHVRMSPCVGRFERAHVTLRTRWEFG